MPLSSRTPHLPTYPPNNPLLGRLHITLTPPSPSPPPSSWTVTWNGVKVNGDRCWSVWWYCYESYEGMEPIYFKCQETDSILTLKR